MLDLYPAPVRKRFTRVFTMLARPDFPEIRISNFENLNFQIHEIMKNLVSRAAHSSLSSSIAVTRPSVGILAK